MIRKVTAFGLSIFLGIGCASVGFAFKDEYDNYADVLKYSTKSLATSKMEQLKMKIKKNEAKIKHLEAKRTELDNNMASKIQLQEYVRINFERMNWFKRLLSKNKMNEKMSKLESDIENIKNDVKLNEKKIKKLQDKRSDLDRELAVLLQIKEI